MEASCSHLSTALEGTLEVVLDSIPFKETLEPHITTGADRADVNHVKNQQLRVGGTVVLGRAIFAAAIGGVGSPVRCPCLLPW